MNILVVIEGAVEEIVFSNEINGYTVCEIKTGNNSITAVGYMPFIHIGETLKLTGKWVKHPDYGEQLKVDAYEKVLPRTADAMEKYLASGIIKGIGPATAKKIVEKFGGDTLEIIQMNPGRLSEIKGINFDKAIRIGQAFDEQRGLRTVVMFFQEYGISPAYSTKIYKIFGDRTIGEIKANPYRLADEIFGIGFKIADKIARNIGINPASKYRVCSGIKYVLSQAAASGHSYVPEKKLVEYTSQLLEVDIENINDALVSLTLDRAVYVENGDNNGNISANYYNKDVYGNYAAVTGTANDSYANDTNTENEKRIYLSAFYHAEIGVCKKLAELSTVNFKMNTDDFDARIDEIQAEEGFVLAEKQKVAVGEALLNGILVITGGPGTGKTTIIKSIIKLLESEGYDIALAAPTGRAAKRMSEAAGFEAKTIHRLLEIEFMGEENELIFSRNESNPIEADTIIIDEMSMVDVLLMNHLLKAITPGTRLILVGDVDQLPSVGAGNVLKDIISSGVIKTVKLTEIFRQEEESMIIVNAHKINKGEPPMLNRKDKDFFFMPKSTADDIVKAIVELCSKRLPDTYGFDPLRHIQVLSPTKKGVTGVSNLNRELQKALNPEEKGKKEKTFRDFTFREGDRVMQIRNNYTLRWQKSGRPDLEGTGVFNGDTGIILEINDEAQMITVLFEDEKVVEYDFSIMDEVEPSFAITIHKSQGSEFSAVILPVFPGPQILMTRNLLYTAVTRAKNLVIIVGYENTLNEMISNDREALRYSGLAGKLMKIIH